MKSVEWKTYRTRFLIKAKQLSSPLTFVDHLGREQCGRKGDYLVESYDGVLSIAPRQIFEDIYVPMMGKDGSEICDPVVAATASLRCDLRAEAIEVERIKPARSVRVEERRRNDHPRLPRAQRKSPQSVRSTASRLGLM
jgi:hypothetical protein